MYIKLPKSIPMPPVLAFSGLLAIVQIVEGTTPYVAAACFTFILFAALAFNLSGGLTYASGAYVTATTVLTLILGIFVKAVLGEPFQRNLLTPDRSLTVYVVGMGSMLAACYANQLLRPKRALLDGMTMQGNAMQVGVMSFAVAMIVPAFLSPALRATFQQANFFTLAAILIPVYEMVRRTDGRRSFNIVSLLAWLYATFAGLITFSKEAMFIPSFAWMIAAVASGYRLSVKKFIAVGTACLLAAMFLTPYSQLGRDFGRNLPTGLAIQLAIGLLSHPLDLREAYQNAQVESLDSSTNYHLYNKPEGLLDRLQMISVDDALIQITDKGDKASPANLWSYFTNLVPRYLNPDKKVLVWGNVYAHPLGMVGDNDDTTGISFSPFADGYHTAQWTGVTLYSFGIFLFGFFLMDAVGGCSDTSIWALLFIIISFHAGPEFLLGGPVYLGGTFSIFVIGVAVICARILPLVTNVFISSSEAQPGFNVDRQARPALNQL